ncbi:hypothetical protein [Methyloversatilis discipulorum]|nr:hypothetical protein [Methyloversatilis discipulorum]
MSQFLRRYLQVCMDAGSFLGIIFGTVGVPFVLLAFVCWRLFR